MFITDYTIEWTGYNEALLSWDGGVSTTLFSIYVDDALVGRLEGSGSLTHVLNMTEGDVHSIRIVQHDSDSIVSPIESRLLSPVVRWLPVTNTAQYYVYELDADDNEYLAELITVDEDDDTEIYEWGYPVPLLLDSVNKARFKVFARGSFGYCETPVVVGGFTGNFPPRVETVTPQTDSSGNLLLILNA